MTLTIDDVLAAFDDFRLAAEAEKSAHAATVLRGNKAADLLAQFLGNPAGLSAADTAAVKTQLTAHLGRLRGLEGGSPPETPGT